MVVPLPRSIASSMTMQDRAKANHDLDKDSKTYHVLDKDQEKNEVRMSDMAATCAHNSQKLLA